MSHLPAPVPGSHAPFAAGERVLLTDRKQRRYLVVLDVGAQWHSHAGALEHDEVIGRPEGIVVRTTKNMELTAFRPTRTDFMMKMGRGAQVIYPKDQAMILSLADIRPGMTVVEAGAGSGALTMALLDAVGPSGRVVSFERRADHLEVAERNVDDWYGARPDHWEVRHGDVVVGLGDLRAHRVVLDMLEPWLVVPAAATALAPGGILTAYMPTVTQVMRFDQACIASSVFVQRTTTETLVRGWDVDNLTVRPHHRMVAHTAFVTTTRRAAEQELGGPPPARPVTGPTVDFVDTSPRAGRASDDAGPVGPAPGQLP
jgi:tRNA (adenine57-N1/adenine58-N1)-methyltransferase